MNMWYQYKSKINKALEEFIFDEKIINTLETAKENNNIIFVAGNGGSADIANHYVCDFSKGANENWKNNKNRFRVICLSSNIGYLSAIANDESYEEVFKEQLVNLASPQDIIILISSSGNSQNIIKAAEYAKSIGMKVIGITGLKGGKLRKISDYSAHIETDLYEISEDIASIFGHFLAWYFRERNLDFKKNIEEESIKLHS